MTKEEKINTIQKSILELKEEITEKQNALDELIKELIELTLSSEIN